MALPIAAIGLGIGALGSLFKGMSQRRQARELERNNPRPTYRIPNEVFENRAIAQQYAQVGLPEQVYNNQLNQIQQNLATGLRNLGHRGNSSFNTNAIVRGANQQVANLNAADAQARVQNRGALYQANQAVASERRNQFNINQLQPYQQNMQMVQQARRAGDQNTFGALSLIAQGAMLGGFDGLKGMFSKGTGAPLKATPTMPVNTPTGPTGLPWVNLFR